MKSATKVSASLAPADIDTETDRGRQCQSDGRGGLGGPLPLGWEGLDVV